MSIFLRSALIITLESPIYVLIIIYIINIVFLFVSSMATDSPVGTPPKCALPPDVTMSTTTTTPPQPRKPLDDDRSEGRPSPRQVTAEELNVLEVCLRRWREEVEGDVKGEWSAMFVTLLH